MVVLASPSHALPSHALLPLHALQDEDLNADALAFGRFEGDPAMLQPVRRVLAELFAVEADA